MTSSAASACCADVPESVTACVADSDSSDRCASESAVAPYVRRVQSEGCSHVKVPYTLM